MHAQTEGKARWHVGVESYRGWLANRVTRDSHVLFRVDSQWTMWFHSKCVEICLISQQLTWVSMEFQRCQHDIDVAVVSRMTLLIYSEIGFIYCRVTRSRQNRYINMCCTWCTCMRVQACTLVLYTDRMFLAAEPLWRRPLIQKNNATM